MKQIREWLESKGQLYAPGVALYEAHGKSRIVLNALRRGESDFTRQKLRQELAALVAAAGPAPAAAPRLATSAPGRATVCLVPPASPAAAPAAAVPPVEPPRVPLEVAAARSSWYAERHRLHATLELLTTDEERRVAGERILVLSEKLTASYQPAGAPVVAPRADLSGLSDQGEIRRLLANLRPQATKLKKNPARALDLQQVQADIKILESKLLKP